MQVSARPARQRLARQRLALVAAALLLVGCGVAAVVFGAQRSLRRAAATARDEHRLRFTFGPVDVASATAANPGFVPVGVPLAEGHGATRGIVFAGQMVLAGPAGLSVAGAANGGGGDKSAHTLRTGVELPVAPISALAVARLRGAAAEQLMLATAGAGLLVLEMQAGDRPRITQLLPAERGTRDLTAILPLASGDLLLGTRAAGVVVFDGATLEPLALPGFANRALAVTALAGSEATGILIGTRDQGLLRLRGGVLERVAAGSGLPDDEVTALLVAGGHIFAGTPAGTAEIDGGAAGLRPIRTLAPGVFAHALAIDGLGRELLVGTLDDGVHAVPLGDAGGGRLRRASINAPALGQGETGVTAAIEAFVSVSGSAPEALAGGERLRRGADGAWEPVAVAPGNALADGNVSALAFGPDGRLYVGFFDRGLDILSLDGTSAPKHLEDDHLFCINRLVVDPRRGTVAAATANGVVLFDSGGVPRQVLTRRDGLLSDHVADVAWTRAGWTAATGAGLTTFGPAGAESLYAFQGLVNNHVYALAGDAGGERLLAGTLGGLSMLKGGVVEHNLTVANSGLRANWITALARLPGGDTLIGTYGAGLMRLTEAGAVSPVELPAGSAKDLVINPGALLVTPGHVFVGTLGHGLLVLSLAEGRWQAVTAGLPSENVTAFAARGGELFVGTDNGLVRIAESRFNTDRVAGGTR